MSKAYAVRVTGMDGAGNTTIQDQTVVYTDTELEARTNGAAQLGVHSTLVEVIEIATLPSDAELKERQANAIRNAGGGDVPDYMRNIHGS